MKAKHSDSMVAGLIILGLLTLAGCSSQHEDARVSQELLQVPPHVSMEPPGASRGPTRQSCKRLVDRETWYKQGLQKYGVNDASSGSLISLMDSEVTMVRYYSALLLGHRKETSAITRLEDALNDKSLYVQRAATTALLQMGNREGIPVLEEFCEKVSKEIEQGDYKNVVDQSDALSVLADAGEVSAIPYLRRLLKYEQSWGIRLTAVRSLSKLYEKDASVLTDIASMLDDEHPQIRTEASEILQRLQVKK